jgi:hypothetical protein
MRRTLRASRREEKNDLSMSRFWAPMPAARADRIFQRLSHPMFFLV